MRWPVSTNIWSIWQEEFSLYMDVLVFWFIYQSVYTPQGLQRYSFSQPLLRLSAGLCSPCFSCLTQCRQRTKDLELSPSPVESNPSCFGLTSSPSQQVHIAFNPADSAHIQGVPSPPLQKHGPCSFTVLICPHWVSSSPVSSLTLVVTFKGCRLRGISLSGRGLDSN